VNLEQIQRAFFEVICQPLNASDGLRPRLPDGRSTRKIAESMIKPNDRLESWERLEIYNQQYWYRILASLAEDFVGLRAVIGQKRYDDLAIAYINDCPSESFTLRNLGRRLEPWLREHSEFVAGVERMALNMVRLEWAEIEAFDGAELPLFTPTALRQVTGDSTLRLQPHLQLLNLDYPVDDLLLRIRRGEPESDMVSNAVMAFPRKSGLRRLALPKPRRVYLVVYRLQRSVYFKRLTRDAFVLVRALGQGKPLAEAIEISLKEARRSASDFKFQLRKWFKNWAALGWFAQAK
jgi:Putative DNA-binding domain